MNPRVRFAMPLFNSAEKDALLKVLEVSKRQPITNGGIVVQFEEWFAEFSGGGIGVAMSSCAATLHMSLAALGIGPGDEVIVPALTHAAMGQACLAVGAKPVFVDAHIDSGNMDPDLIEITPRTRAISVVHYLGQPAYMKSLTDLCRRHNLPLIEDCALAIGAKHPVAGPVGLIGDVGCFSFYPTKHITTGEGGMALVKSPELAVKLKAMRRFGHLGRDDDITMFGLNYRMNEFQAALGMAQMKQLPAFQTRRRRNASLLRSLLQDYWIVGGDYALAVFVQDRDKVRAKLWDELIETSVYYPRPVPDYTLFRERFGEQACPVARKFCNETVCLSIGPHLTDEKIHYMAEEFRKCALPL